MKRKRKNQKTFKGYNYRDVQMGDFTVEAFNEEEAKEKIVKEMLKNLKNWLNSELTIYEVKSNE